MSARVGVVVLPGACDQEDALLAVNRTPGLEGQYLPHVERDLKGSEAVILPGGFSYGDYLRAGAIARFAPVMEAVTEFARAVPRFRCFAEKFSNARSSNARLSFLTCVQFTAPPRSFSKSNPPAILSNSSREMSGTDSGEMKIVAGSSATELIAL